MVGREEVRLGGVEIREGGGETDRCGSLVLMLGREEGGAFGDFVTLFLAKGIPLLE